MSEKRKYTLGEEIFNSVSHGVGACLSVAGTAVMIVASVIHTDVWGIVSSCIYGASLIILYTMSTLYHSFTNKKAKAFFRIMDHNTIFLLIAGTYTPITLYYLQGAVGWILFGIVWGAAIFGIVMNSINLEKARIPSIFCYVAMGWVIIFAIDTILIAHHISICQTCHLHNIYGSAIVWSYTHIKLNWFLLWLGDLISGLCRPGVVVCVYRFRCEQSTRYTQG